MEVFFSNAFPLCALEAGKPSEEEQLIDRRTDGAAAAAKKKEGKTVPAQRRGTPEEEKQECVASACVRKKIKEENLGQDKSDYGWRVVVGPPVF